MNKKSKRLLTWLLVVSMIVVQMLFSVPAFAETRHGGADRYETAAKIALTFEESEYAVLATGEEFPDALCAAPLAKAYDAPIILTGPGALNSYAKGALEDLGVKNVIIVGGEKAVSASVASAVEAMGISIERLAGTDRIGTSLEIAKKLVDKLGEDPEAVMLATAANFPDALSGSPIAAAKGMPILLTNKDSISDDVVEFIGDAKVYVLGGTAVISETVANKFDDVERLGGTDRYATNLGILEAFAEDLDFGTVYVATGEKFPDALAGAVLAAGSPLVIVNDSVSSAMKEFLKENLSSASEVVVLGGTSAVSSSVVSAIMAIITGSTIGDVEEVEATTTVVDNTTRDQVLEFKVNGKAVTVEDMEDEGYDVEFQATEDVFDTSYRDQSSTGILNAQQLQEIYEANAEGHRNFDYTVILSKDDEEWESDSQTVKIVDEALDVEGIGDAEVICTDAYNTSTDFTLNSKTLVVGEIYEFGDIPATLPDGVEIDDIAEMEDYDIEFDTSDPTILAVDNNGVLIPNQAGEAAITITAGSIEKEVEFTVVTAKRVAKDIAFTEESIKMSRGAWDPYAVGITVKDQYGDPVPDINLRNFVDLGTSDDIILKDNINNNMLWTNAIAVADYYPGQELTDDGGEGTILVWTHDLWINNGWALGVGTGTITLHRRGSSQKLATLTVNTSSDSEVENYELKRFYGFLGYDNDEEFRFNPWREDAVDEAINYILDGIVEVTDDGDNPDFEEDVDRMAVVSDQTDNDFGFEVGDDPDSLVLNGYTRNGYFLGHIPVQYFSRKAELSESIPYVANTNEEVVAIDENTINTTFPDEWHDDRIAEEEKPLQPDFNFPDDHDGTFDVDIIGQGTAKVEAYMDGQRIAYVTYKVSDHSTDIAKSTFHELEVTETNPGPFDLKRDIINKLILTSGKAVNYVVVDDNLNPSNTGEWVVLYQDDGDEIDSIDGGFDEHDTIVGMIGVTSNVRNYDDDELGAQNVAVLFAQIDPDDADYDNNPVLLGKFSGIDFNFDHDDLDLIGPTSFEKGDEGKIYLTLYRGVYAEDQAVDSVTITVDVQ